MLKQKFRNTGKAVFPGENGFASLIGLLIALLIAGYLFYMVMNSYTKNTTSEDSGATSNPRAVLDRAKSAVDAINKQQTKRMEDFK